MQLRLIFEEWPEDRQVSEIWLTKLEGEGVVTQASLNFSREAAATKAAVFQAEAPGIASVVGPFILGPKARSERK